LNERPVTIATAMCRTGRYPCRDAHGGARAALFGRSPSALRQQPDPDATLGL